MVRRVFEQIRSRVDLLYFDRVYFHAGKRYRQHLISKLEKMDIKCEAPLKNLGIGKQLAGCKEHDC